MDGFLLSGNDYEFLRSGAWITIQILVYSFLLGVFLSLIFGVGRLSERKWVRGAALGYVEFARGISSIVLLFIMAIAVPILLRGVEVPVIGEIEQPPLLLLGTVALGINMGGYGAEIVRGAIQAIPKGQTEASIALNLSPTQRLRYVVLPQAMRIILPPMGNLTIEILKGTALVSLIGLTDIMQATQNIRTRGLAGGDATDFSILYMNALVLYFILAQLINGIFRFFEWRLEKQYEGGEAIQVPANLEHAGPGVAG